VRVDNMAERDSATCEDDFDIKHSHLLAKRFCVSLRTFARSTFEET
jgi:hypothetical protein